MKLTAGTDQLAIALREPTLNELVRTLREDSRELVAEERRLARAAAKSGHPFNPWGGGGFAGLLHGKHGIGGGPELTFENLGFILIAYLLGCARRDTARKTLGMIYALATVHWRGWKETATWPPVKEPEEPVKICPRTGERFFGGALIRALADPALQLDEISVCGDRDAAMLEFGDNNITTFVRWPPGRPDTYAVRHLPAFLLRPLLDAINEEARWPSSAA